MILATCINIFTEPEAMVPFCVFLSRYIMILAACKSFIFLIVCAFLAFSLHNDCCMHKLFYCSCFVHFFPISSLFWLHVWAFSLYNDSRYMYKHFHQTRYFRAMFKYFFLVTLWFSPHVKAFYSRLYVLFISLSLHNDSYCIYELFLLNSLCFIHLFFST